MMAQDKWTLERNLGSIVTAVRGGLAQTAICRSLRISDAVCFKR